MSEKTNERFREYATSTAFNLNLSKNMIEWLFYLRATDKDYYCRIEYPRNFKLTVVTLRSLIDRGFVEMKMYSGPPYSSPVEIAFISNVGRKVCELLEYAGFKPADYPKIKRHKKQRKERYDARQ